MITSSSPQADFSGLVDEQLDLGDPPAGKPENGWKINSRFNREFPFHCVIDLGAATPLAVFWFFDTHNIGTMLVSTGGPDAWQELATIETRTYMQWRSVPVNRETRYLRVEILQPSAIFTEIALDAYSPNGWRAERERLAEEQRQQALEAALPQAEVFWHVLDPIGADTIRAAPRLRLIQKIGVGVNTIDLEAARRRGIAVCNMPGARSSVSTQSMTKATGSSTHPWMCGTRMPLASRTFITSISKRSASTGAIGRRPRNSTACSPRPVV